VIQKNYITGLLLEEFTNRNWSISGLNRFLVKVDKYGSADHRADSTLCHRTQTDENTDTDVDLV